MAYALSTQGQGGGYLSFTAIANTAGTPWVLGGVFTVHSLGVNAQLVGSSGSTQIVLRVYPDGRLSMRSGAEDRIVSPVGSVQVGVPFEWKIVNNTSTGNWELYLNDMVTPVGTFARGSSAWGINQLGRFSSTAVTEITVESFYCSGSTYNATWDKTTANSVGRQWISDNVARALTLTAFTGAEDSWWVYYPDTVDPLLPVALSTNGQGPTSYIQVHSTQFNFNQSANPGVSTVEFEISLDDFRGSTTGYLLGASGSSQSFVSVDSATMQLRLVHGLVTRISSSDNAIVLGQKHRIRIRWDKTSGLVQMWLDGTLLSGEYNASTNWSFGFNQVGRYHTTTTTGVTLYSLSVGGNPSTYAALWDGYTIPVTGSTWDDGSSRLLTIMNAEGTADSWWKYGGSPPVDQEITLGPLDSTVTFGNPTVTQDKQVDIGVLNSATQVYTPSVSKTKTIGLSTIGSTVVVGNPTVRKDKLVTPSTIGSTVTFGNLTITKTALEKFISLSTIGSTTVVRNPTLRKDKWIQLLPIGSTATLFDLTLLKDKWISLDYIGETSVTYEPEVLGGAKPLPKIILFTDEGFGLHIRSAEEMNAVLLDLAKRIQILESK
jgi:hypothetical protein